MRVQFQLVPLLPKLAWLAEVNLDEMTASVRHGQYVEVRSGFFIEGVWNGPFAKGDFGRTEAVFGSGGIVSGAGILFVSSSSTTDSLFHARTGARLTVSNSLPFLLAGIGDRLDPSFTGYDRCNESIMLGINRYIREIPTSRGTVCRLMYRNLLVTRDGITEIDKPMPPPFRSFSDYSSYLAHNLKLILTNARDADRATPMEILSTQSRGYDSTAVNALVAPFGVDKVFTVRQGKGRDVWADADEAIQVDDDGTAICRALALPCVPIDRRAFERGFEDEHLFCAGVHNNGDANFKEVFQHVRDVAILLTGCLGETWYVVDTYSKDRSKEISPDLTRWDLGNHGLGEVRLQVGFVQVAPAYIGGRRREEIFRITESDEMMPWRLGTAYDRPIPRRIAEQAGVPRDLFGQVKMASTVEFALPRIPYGKDLRREYFDFLVTNGLLSRWATLSHRLVHRINAIVHFATPRRYRAIYYLERAISRLLGREYRFPLIWQRLAGSIFCFCVNKRIKAYQSRV